jgi:hypothetical protein
MMSPSFDKNQTPGWDPEDPSNPDESGEQGKFVATAADRYLRQDQHCCDWRPPRYFKINAYAPKYAGDKWLRLYFTDYPG